MIKGLKISSKKISKFIFILLLANFIYGCSKNSDTVAPTTPTANLTATPHSTALTTIPAGRYDITKCLPKGYVKTGTVDYTSYIQAAITANANVTFPAFPIMVDDKGIIIPSNRTLNFLSGSQIILKPSANSDYNIFRIDHASNVVMNSPVIVGDFGKHLATSGEWGMGISIYSSSSITINSANISYCWGDGIYLSTSNGTTTNTKISIISPYLIHNRRNGMSVTSVNGLDLESLYAGYSTGTSPMCGVDFEPSSSTDQLQNIVVNNPQTGYNAGYGIQIGYSNLYGGSNKTTSITINNHSDKRSAVAFKASAVLTKRKSTETITGPLTINNPEWRLNTTSALTASLYEHNIKLTITKPTVEDATGTFLTQAATLSYLIYKTRMLSGSNYLITF
jgi:hypothetical protein